MSDKEKKTRPARQPNPTLDTGPGVIIEPLPDGPRFTEAAIPELGGPVLISRLTNEQRYAFRQRFLALGFRRPADVALPAATDPAFQRTRRHLVKLVQASARRDLRETAGRTPLAAPGDRGFRLLERLPDEDLLALVARIVTESQVLVPL
jgi:hypothetical protein